MPKEGCAEQLFESFKQLAANTLKNENGCITYNVTRQVPHPGAKGESKYKIVLLQEYVDTNAFDAHSQSLHVQEFIKKNIEENDIIADWRSRVLSNS